MICRIMHYVGITKDQSICFGATKRQNREQRGVRLMPSGPDLDTFCSNAGAAWRAHTFLLMVADMTARQFWDYIKTPNNVSWVNAMPFNDTWIYRFVQRLENARLTNRISMPHWMCAVVGAVEGSAAGAVVGAVDGVVKDSLDGALAGTQDGAVVGAEAGAEAGAMAGTQDGTLAGTPDAAVAGAEAGVEAGAMAGAQDGTVAGAQEGTKAIRVDERHVTPEAGRQQKYMYNSDGTIKDHHKIRGEPPDWWNYEKVCCPECTNKYFRLNRSIRPQWPVDEHGNVNHYVEWRPTTLGHPKITSNIGKWRSHFRRAHPELSEAEIQLRIEKHDFNVPASTKEYKAKWMEHHKNERKQGRRNH